MSRRVYTLDFGKGQVTLKFSSLGDASKVCMSEPRVWVEGTAGHDRVSFGVRLPDNLLNHVLVLSKANYTCGFPFELAKGVSLEKLVKIAPLGVGSNWWFLCASILASDLNGLEGLLEGLEELEAFIHEEARPNKLKPAYTEEWWERIARPYPDVGSWGEHLAKLGKELNRETLQGLRDAIEECYNTFYSEYWDKREKQMLELSGELKRVVDILQPLKRLEEVTRTRFEPDTLEVFLVDVFRNGGGIYGAFPNRMVSISGFCTPLYVHTAIAHETGHMLSMSGKQS